MYITYIYILCIHACDDVFLCVYKFVYVFVYIYIYTHVCIHNTLYCIILCYTGLYHVKPYFINYIIVVHYVGMMKHQIACKYIYIYYIYMYEYMYMYI